MSAVMPTRHPNRPQPAKPTHARVARKIRHDVRTYDNPAQAACFRWWAAQHLESRK